MASAAMSRIRKTFEPPAEMMMPEMVRPRPVRFTTETMMPAQAQTATMPRVERVPSSSASIMPVPCRPEPVVRCACRKALGPETATAAAMPQKSQPRCGR